MHYKRRGEGGSHLTIIAHPVLWIHICSCVCHATGGGYPLLLSHVLQLSLELGFLLFQGDSWMVRA